MKTLQHTGLLLFLAGLFVFVGTIFMGTYRLEEATLQKHVSDKAKAQGFYHAMSSESLARTFSYVWDFVPALTHAFEAYNETQQARYALSEGDKQQVVDALPEAPFVFDSQWFLALRDADTLAQHFKHEALQSTGAWLGGRTYARKEAFAQDLNLVAENIATYGIVSAKGFDAYEIKRLRYVLAKDSLRGYLHTYPERMLLLTYVLAILGALLYILPKYNLEGPPGIKNNGIFHSAMKNKGWLGMLTGTLLIAFYIILYFYPEYMVGWIRVVDPLSVLLKGTAAGQFFLYGFLYTLAIAVMGTRMLIKYRHSTYHVVRTCSLIFFQTAFAFLLPEILLRLKKPYFDFKNIWPLDYDFFFDVEIDKLMAGGQLGLFMLGWGIGLALLAVPVLTYFFGKRWYCSWVCGCGGLAETLGDPYRQLSDKSLPAWKVERWTIHSILVFSVLMTVGVLYSYWTETSRLLNIDTYYLRQVYGVSIGAIFAGVVGTGFYPMMGSRVWCRFGCPLAALLGLMQRFKSRFRITTNGGQCMSCGNCSTHCEMGIDVRWYAQRGQNIIRASCVGCGVCSSVCPRGVLKLEQKGEQGRFGKPILIGHQAATSLPS